MKTSLYQAGWRPFIGWVCGAALMWNFIFQPVLLWVAWMNPQWFLDMSTSPQLEVGELMTVVLSMLGLAGARSYDKKQGNDTRSIGREVEK